MAVISRGHHGKMSGNVFPPPNIVVKSCPCNSAPIAKICVSTSASGNVILPDNPSTRVPRPSWTFRSQLFTAKLWVKSQFCRFAHTFARLEA